MISTIEIARVQDSFMHCLAMPDRVASAFYARLFAGAPAIRRMFTGDMAAQNHKLMMTLAAIVDGLDRLDELVPVARALAVRHASYGVVDAHYALVGSALIETLREFLGPEFDAETEAAWGAAYMLLSETMMAATRDVA